MKKVIRITESKLNKMIVESVKRILKEKYSTDPADDSGWPYSDEDDYGDVEDIEDETEGIEEGFMDKMKGAYNGYKQGNQQMQNTQNQLQNTNQQINTENLKLNDYVVYAYNEIKSAIQALTYNDMNKVNGYIQNCWKYLGYIGRELKNTATANEARLHKIVSETIKNVLIEEGFMDKMQGAYNGYKQGNQQMQNTQNQLQTNNQQIQNEKIKLNAYLKNAYNSLYSANNYLASKDMNNAAKELRNCGDNIGYIMSIVRK